MRDPRPTHLAQSAACLGPVRPNLFTSHLKGSLAMSIQIARHLARRTPLIGLTFTLALSGEARAQFCDSSVQAVMPRFQSFYGTACSVQGTRAIVGAPQDAGGSMCPTGAGSGGSATIHELIGGEWTVTATLTSPNPECEGRFGYDVSIVGEFAAVGAPFEDVGGVSDAGRVYIFRRINGVWSHVQTLTELTAYDSARFGHSLSLDGASLAVGAIRSDAFGPDSGACYMYGRVNGQYVFEDRVGPNAPGQPVPGNAFFGTSVAVAGPYCAVGAVYEGQIGSAYIFERASNGTWSEDAKFFAPAQALNSFFGVSVDLVGGVMVVGAEGVTNGAQQSGAAFVYRHQTSGWALEAELGSPQPIANGTFGRAVSFAPGRVLVTDISVPGGGRAYIYRLAQGGIWQIERTLAAGMGFGNDGFGTDAQISGDIVLVGAPLRTTSAPFSGGADLFDLDFVDCNSNGTNDFCELQQGAVVDCDGNGLLDSCEIAANPALDCNGDGQLDSCSILSNPTLDCDGNGLIDACELAAQPNLDCNGNGQLDVCEIATGQAIDLNANGVPDTCEPVGTNPGCQSLVNSTGFVGRLRAIGTGSLVANDILLLGSQMPLNTFGYPLVSRTPNQVVPSNSVGFLCIGGSIGRSFPAFNTGATGTMSRAIDLLAIPAPNGTITGSIGETWYWQLWHRDSFAGQATSTFTDSLIFTIQ
ncbi:MAG: FG-GAP repeat protein [Planctomycetota bacterium]